MTKEEKQNIKLEKVDDKTAYKKLLIKYAELENKIADIKANCDLAIEGRDIKIMELEKENAELKHNKKTVVHLADCLEEKMKERIEELEQQIEHLTKEVNDLENMKATLESRIADLTEQIEQMKCCEICAYGGNDFGVCYSNKPCKNKNKWKLAKWVKGR